MAIAQQTKPIPGVIREGRLAEVTCLFAEIHPCSKWFLYLKSHKETAVFLYNTAILSRTKGQIYSTYTKAPFRSKQ